MKKAVLFTESPDVRYAPEIAPHGVLRYDHAGNPRIASPWGFFTTFELLPAAAVAAGTEKLLLSLGTNTEVIARSAKGGVNVKTDSAKADNDNAMLIGIANTGSVNPITAASRIRFSTRVRLSQVEKIVFGAGLDENLTSPVGPATAGEGAQFLFDPEGENATGLDADTQENFILAQKVNGTDTFIDSGIKVQSGRDYELAIQIGEDLKPVYYIDGVNVGTGASALTSGDSVGVVIGIQMNDAAAATTVDFDCRYVAVERRIG